MKTTCTLLLFLITAYASQAQDRVYGIIEPDKSYENTTGGSIYYMDYPTIKRYMDYETMHKYDSMKLKTYEELVENLGEQQYLYDSLNRLGKLEANYWYDHLLKTDKELQESKKEVVILKDKNQDLKRSRVYFLIFGALAGFFGWATLN